VDPTHLPLNILREDEEFILYRGEHSSRSGSRSVLLLAPSSRKPSLETLKKLEHEYSLRNALDPAWAARPIAVTKHLGQTAIVLEDPGGMPLDRFASEPGELKSFLRIAVGLASALGGLHQRGLIHKDVKPANVLFDSATGEVRLIGFGIASRLPRERQAPGPAEFIAGTLPYMAPEQTGRMNRSVDSRSDLYALGITLYEMLTGSLPFTASEPMEWIHCHIAKQPLPPADRVQSIPGAVSAIILKLLAKTPEERYQTAVGVESDFRRCLEDLDRRGSVCDFALGGRDRPDYLQIPERLYGRKREIETLLASFDRIVNGGVPELVLVSGYSGIGKSSVVNELQPVLVPPRGLFAAGKFDQYKRDIPYSTLAQAFQRLIRPLLTKSETELGKWRSDLCDALDQNGQLIVDLVPELKLVIGDQPPVPEVPVQDAQRRFQLVFRRFISVFARREHPLALFLDDLQWLDAATLDLLEDLLTRSELPHLMLIGAYRDNEVDAVHPLMRKLEAIKSAGGKVKEIRLAPLAQEHIEQLLTDALRCAPGHIAPLAELVHQKTGGNPFFTIQFISSLADEKMLTFDHDAACWGWDLSRIHAKGYTDNVVDLMIMKLIRLPSQTQMALQQMACLGNIAEITILSIILEMSQQQVNTALWESVRQGLVEQLDGAYKFIHDRVQEAAYSLISEALRPEAHLRIGRLMVAHTSPEKREETVFDIVNQLNRGAALISSREEREHLAELNLSAGKHAKGSTAYASALKYLVAGAALLADDCWERRRDLIFTLELERAECEFLTGELAAADERLTDLTSRTGSTVERAAVSCLHIDVCTTLGQSGRAVDVALDYLRHVGIEWSPHPTEDEARREYEQIWLYLGSRAIEDVVDSPFMSDAESLATAGVLTKLVVPAFFTDQNLDSLTICKAVNLSLERGNCDASCLAYITLGRIAGPRFRNYQAAFRFGQVGFELVERRGLKRFQAGTYLYYAAWIARWMKHVRTSSELQRRAFEAANRIGDLTYAAYATVNLNSDLLVAGDPLSEVQREAELGLAFAQKAQFGIVSDVTVAQLALIRTLRGLTSKFGCFDSEEIEELPFELHLASNPGLAIAECWYWVRKLQARFFAGNYKEAAEASSKAQQLLWTSPAFFEEAEYHFYAALSHAASGDSLPADERGQHLEILARHQRQLEIWAENCPDNFENRAALVGAEIAQIEGRHFDAMRLYEKAIHSSRKSGFVQNEALAYERASSFYRARGFDQIAGTYLREARSCYASWGADGKVRQLDRLYPGLKQEQPVSVPASTITATFEGLDLATVIRVSQAVSSEIVLEKLFDTVMRKAMEHAGAERGLLVLPYGDDLHIEAESRTFGNDVIVSLSESSAAAMPESILRYVMRTHESVILDDASLANPFSADPYFVEHRVRSILCLPLLNHAKPSGVLYLENNLAPRVFTSDRITVLSVLASQAAISLENTRLYRDLEDREAKIRRLVDANILGITTWSVEGAILVANEAFLRMVQYDNQDVAAGRVRWWDMTPAEWREQAERALAEVIQTGTVQPFESEFFRRDGSRVPVLIGATLFQEGGTDGVAFVLDLSEQKRAEDRLRAVMSERTRLSAFRAEIAMALASKDTLRGILHRCAETAVRHLDAAFARIWTLKSEGTELELEASAGMYTRLDGRFSRIPLGDLKIGMIARERKAHLTNDVQGDPGISDHDWARAEKMQSFAGYPLVVEERVVGVIGLFSRQVLTESTLETLASVADAIAQGIDRKRAEEMLRQSEAELRTITDTIPHPIVVMAPNGATLYVNQVASDRTGYTLDQLDERGFWARVIHPDDLKRLGAERQERLLSGVPFELEFRVLYKSGQYRWVLMQYSPLRDESGQTIRWYSTATDIDDRKRAEDALKLLKDQLYKDNLALREEVERTSMFDEIVGTSNPLKAVLSRIAKVAPTDSTVLIAGETGTGKELIARAIHKESRRVGRPFVSVNCAAIPRDLILSELFGHEKGAFTGATQRRLGRFELADGGTIFLDEVGELLPDTQVALLRVLQERELERVGGGKSIHIDVRVIAATNRDLEAEVANGTFRQDLFYRLNVFPIEVPPLRERKDDLLLLVEYFVQRYGMKAGKDIRSIDKKTLNLLQSYDWPGNIRELQNVIERSVILCSGDVFSIDESWLSKKPFPSAPQMPLSAAPQVQASVLAEGQADPRSERAMIEAALAASRGRVSGPSGAAARLGIPSSTLSTRIKALKIDKVQFKFR
jgi:PAS domain S-box-containing protein